MTPQDIVRQVIRNLQDVLNVTSPAQLFTAVADCAARLQPLSFALRTPEAPMQVVVTNPEGEGWKA